MQNKWFYGYKIIETISSNNRFIVCKAYNKDENVVVLKIARTDFLNSNPEAIDKEFRAADAMTAISRKYNPLRLVRVFDVVRTNKVFYIVMEYIEGISLEKTIPRMSLPRNQVDLDDIENQLTDIVRTISGFGYTPAAISPSNVIVTPRDSIVLLNYVDMSPGDMAAPNLVDEFMDKLYSDVQYYDDYAKPAAMHDSSYSVQEGQYYNNEQPRKKTVVIGLFIIVAFALLAILFLLVQRSYSNSSPAVATEYSTAKEIIPFKKDGLYGFKDSNGKTLVRAKYDYLEDFSEGRAVVGHSGLYGYIDGSGREIIRLKYTKASPFSKSKAKVENSKENKSYIIDPNGNIVEEFPLKQARYRY